ncbi:hypothetical protein pdam_00018209 [Pocillopora damicornis]|uniref:Uncharacterized protein n=1 Tax=Pocillopora damicornis TaxID=46731 RepID=A0A3M6U6Q9_POCDA|nr:hypothetical protein pdam_00018209 [Pocillopora damicornis]
MYFKRLLLNRGTSTGNMVKLIDDYVFWRDIEQWQRLASRISCPIGPELSLRPLGILKSQFIPWTDSWCPCGFPQVINDLLARFNQVSSQKHLSMSTDPYHEAEMTELAKARSSLLAVSAVLALMTPEIGADQLRPFGINDLSPAPLIPWYWVASRIESVLSSSANLEARRTSPKNAKAERGLGKSACYLIWKKLGIFIPVGSGICLNCRVNLDMQKIGELPTKLPETKNLSYEETETIETSVSSELALNRNSVINSGTKQGPRAKKD